MCSTIDTTFKSQTIISLQAINLVSFSFTDAKLNNNCFLLVIYFKAASQHRYQLMNNKYFCRIFKCSVWIFLMQCNSFSFSGNAPLSGKSTSAVSSSTEDENTGRKKSVLGLYLNAYGVLFIQRYSMVSLAYHSLCTACPVPPAMGWLLDFCGKGWGLVISHKCKQTWNYSNYLMGHCICIAQLSDQYTPIMRGGRGRGVCLHLGL